MLAALVLVPRSITGRRGAPGDSRAALARQLPAAFAIGVKRRVNLAIATEAAHTVAVPCCSITPTPACSPKACRSRCSCPAASRGNRLHGDADAPRRSHVRAGRPPRPVAVGPAASCVERVGPLRRAASIPTSRKSRATRGWPATAACRKSASRPISSAERAPTSSSCRSIASAISVRHIDWQRDAAHGQADRSRISGRTRSVRDAARRLRPPHARRRS